MPITLAPGVRVEIRGEEWIIQSADRLGQVNNKPAHSLLVTGVSELVRDQTTRFLTHLENESLKVVDPSETILTTDDSPQFRRTRLYLQSLLLQSPLSGDGLGVGHLAAVDDLPYQRDPALQALQQPRQRILIADSTGLGKTIEIGILLSELIARNRARRILAITPKATLAQFQQELYSRFTIPLQTLDRSALERIEREIPAHANPFYYYDRVVISIDTLKQSVGSLNKRNAFATRLENTHWDVIVIDEAQNVAERDQKSMRNKLARLLAPNCDTLIMASATPHDGKAPSFASLMNLLNPTAIADENNYTKEDIRGLFIRRFKHHVQAQIQSSFEDRITVKHSLDPTPAEESAFEALATAKFQSFDTKTSAATGQILFRQILEKSLFSSPAAALASINARQLILSKRSPTAATAADQTTLAHLHETISRITPDKFTKFQSLVKLLSPAGRLQWDPSDPHDRLVIFGERLPTLRFLEQHLPKALNLAPGATQLVHGEMEQHDIAKVIQDFNTESAPIRLLLASDIASEGLNLHHFAHKLIHFDIPWSLMTFQQRNGRIDRYGQKKRPEIHYLYTTSDQDQIKGDLRILELLMEKDEQAQKNIGDPSAFLNVFDSQQEESIIADAMRRRLTPEAFSVEQSASSNWLEDLLNSAQAPAPQAPPNHRPSFFPSDFAYLQASLEFLDPDNRFKAQFNAAGQIVSFDHQPDQFQRAFHCVPRAALPTNNRFVLSSNRELIKAEIDRARSNPEGNWPATQLLWPLHPVFTWLNRKLVAQFPRNVAPVIPLPTKLAPRSAYYLIQGEITNSKSQPIVQDWFLVVFEGAAFSRIITLAEFLALTGFDKIAFPNPGNLSEQTLPTRLQSLVPQAIEQARLRLSDRLIENKYQLSKQLAQERSLLIARKHAQLNLFQPSELHPDSPLEKHRRESRRATIEQTFSDWEKWIEAALTVEDAPWFRLAAVFIP